MLILCFKIPPIVEEIAQWLRPGFDSQHSQGSSKLSVKLVPGRSDIASAGTRYICGTKTYKQVKYLYI